MKYKISFSLFFLLIIMYIYISMYKMYELKNYKELINFGEKDSCVYNAVIDTGANYDDDVYECLKNNADKYNINIYATNIKEEKNKKEITRYAYITDFSFCSDIRLESGSFFDRSNIESDYYLTTEKCSDSKKLGEIASFSENTIFKLMTLKSGLDDNPFNLNITFSGRDYNFDDMVTDLKNNGISCYTTSVETEVFSVDIFPFCLIIIFSMIIMILINVYDLFNSYKEIAVKKMLGYSYITICMEKIRFIFLSQTIISFVIYNMLKLILKVKKSSLSDEFNRRILSLYGGLIIASVISVFLVYLFSKSFSVSELIKNNDQNIKIILFNMLFKAIVTAVALFFAFNIFQDYCKIHSSKYQKWKECQDYYCVSGIATVSEDADIKSANAFRRSYSVYKDLNARGAVLCDFTSHSKDEIDFYKKKHGEDKLFMYLENYVNPNYLKNNIILDSSGKRVEISEECDKITYLIPEKYRNYEEQAFEVIQDWSDAKDEDINIIWIKNDQKAFTYNWYVGMENGCYIKDPVLCVYTLNNTSAYTFWYFCGAYNAPVKFKCSDTSDIKFFYQTLYKYFDKSIYRYNVYNFYDSVAAEIEKTDMKLKYDIVCTVCLLIILILMIVQNICVYLMGFEKEVAVFTLMGYRFFHIHSFFFLQFVFYSISVLLVELLIVHNMKAELLFLLYFVVEFIVTCVLTYNYGRNNTVNLLKKS